MRKREKRDSENLRERKRETPSKRERKIERQRGLKVRKRGE